MRFGQLEGNECSIGIPISISGSLLLEKRQ